VKTTLPGRFSSTYLRMNFRASSRGNEDIGLKGPADEIDRKLTEWAVFADPCVAEKDVNVLGHCGSTYAHKMMTIEA
jgi:hypothetical protein